MRHVGEDLFVVVVMERSALLVRSLCKMSLSHAQ